MRLYHGSQNEVVEPVFGLGQVHHDLDLGLAVEKVGGQVLSGGKR